MPTPDENMQSVRAFAEEAFGNKNLDYAAEWLADDFVEHQVFPGTTPDKRGGIDSYRIFFAASPDMTAGIHDMVAAGDKVAIRATYRGTDGKDRLRGGDPACIAVPIHPAQLGAAPRDAPGRRSGHPPWTALGGSVVVCRPS